MDEINEKFNEYMMEVKKLDTSGKRYELYNSLKKLADGIKEMADADGIELSYLQNREIEDLKNPDLSENDFLEGMLVYFETVKEMIGQYLLGITNR